MKDNWKNLPVKTKFLYSTALMAFLCGWVLTFWGFNLPPVGVVDNTVIVILGQSMTYAAAAFGLKEYLDYEIAKTKKRDGDEDTEQ